jgi:TP901 family phage tail tape measure protein
MPSFSNAQVPIRINVKGAKKATNDFNKIIKSTKDLGTSSKEATKQLKDQDSVMSSLMDSAKRLAAAYVGFNILKDIVTIGAEFEAQMDRVKAISGATEEQFKKLTDSARELGATTQFTAAEVAKGQEYLALAGMKTNQILDAMPGLLALSAASGEDFARMADIVSDQLSALGLHAGDAGRLSDAMAFSMGNANTNVEMLGRAMSYAAPVMKVAQQSMESVTTAISLMSNEGIKGTRAGTALRMAVIRLSKPPRMAAKAIKSLGLAITDVKTGNFRDIADILEDLNKSTEKLTAAGKVAKIAAIFGVEATPGLITLIKRSKEMVQTVEIMGEKVQITTRR